MTASARTALRVIKDKDVRKILRAALDQGFDLIPGRKGGSHPRVLDPRGRIVSVCPGTSGDWRTRANMLADLRRAGFIWPPKHA